MLITTLPITKQKQFRGVNNPGKRTNLIFLRPAHFPPPVVPLLEGHVPDDVAAVAAAEDEQAGHGEVADEEDCPGVGPEAVLEVRWHRVELILETDDQKMY